MSKDFLKMENKDAPLSVGQKVQVVKKLEFPKADLDKFCQERNMSEKQKTDYIKASGDVFDRINEKIANSLVGIIVSVVMGDNYVVRFDEEDSCFQFNIDEVDLGERKFFVFTKEHLIPFDVENKLSGLATAIFQKKQGASNDFLQKIKEVDNRIKSKQQAIIDYREQFNREFSEMNLDKNKKVALLEKLSENKFDTSMLEKQLAKIEKNPKIEKIEFVENNNRKYLIVRTSELMYSSVRVVYNQGKFTFVLGLDDNSIIVYGSRYYRDNCNPCVSSSGSVCFGEDTSKYQRMLTSGDIIPLILAMIPFLEEPNYNSPHRQDYDTYFGQDLLPNKEFDYDVLLNYVTKANVLNTIIRANFSDSKFQEDMKKKSGKKVERLRTGEIITPMQPIEDADTSADIDSEPFN